MNREKQLEQALTELTNDPLVDRDGKGNYICPHCGSDDPLLPQYAYAPNLHDWWCPLPKARALIEAVESCPLGKLQERDRAIRAQLISDMARHMPNTKPEFQPHWEAIRETLIQQHNN